MATYAVGDIQGCLSHLKTLLEKVAFSSEDKLWLAGDLVNRGPESLETLRFIRSLGESAFVVLGNHDLHLLACYFGSRTPGKKDTFREILEAPDLDELMHWLRYQPLLYRDAGLGYTMVHAGIPPNWSLEFAQARAKEVEASLRSSEPSGFFENMYGNKPATWSDELSGYVRLRTITNYFTRMRFCTADGKLEFDSKCGPNTPPRGFLPWYSHQNHKCKNENILFGHWAAMLGKSGSEHFIGLDTGCVWGGELTAIQLENKERSCVSCAL